MGCSESGSGEKQGGARVPQRLTIRARFTGRFSSDRKRVFLATRSMRKLHQEPNEIACKRAHQIGYRQIGYRQIGYRQIGYGGLWRLEHRLQRRLQYRSGVCR